MMDQLAFLVFTKTKEGWEREEKEGRGMDQGVTGSYPGLSWMTDSRTPMHGMSVIACFLLKCPVKER